MSEPYVGEIRLVGFNFAPVNWSLCNGAVQSIAQNDVLFNLIGTTYGGDGVNTFRLPDLQGRVAVHQGAGFVMGQTGGTETVTLTQSQMPSHIHALNASSAFGTTSNPNNSYPAAAPLALGFSYSTATTANAAMGASTISNSGGSQPHDNMQPYLILNYIISLFGVYPSQ